jgi:hypothetical protein
MVKDNVRLTVVSMAAMIGSGGINQKAGFVKRTKDLLRTTSSTSFL